MSQAQYLPVLPPELIVEVLSWVPVNHLMRFRCVCKTWKSIIFDPTFVKLQLKRSSKRTHILITAQEAFDDTDYHYGDTYSIPYPIDQLFENPYSINDEDIYYELKANYWIIGSCNGLVCLGGHNTQDDFEEYWIRFWNPATRMRSKKSPFFRVNTCCQRFEPSTSMRFGFVYDDLSDIYKVVSIFLDCSSKKTEVRVYCLGDNCWRMILSCPIFPILSSNGIFVNGTINWLALDMLNSHYQWRNVIINQLVIFSFDLQKETYKYLSLPDGLCQFPKSKLYLVDLGDCLCLYHDCHGTHFVVWQMKEFGVENSWTLLVKVTYEHLQMIYPPMRQLFPLCISENGDILILVNNDDLEVVLYNRRNNKVDVIQIPNGDAWWEGTKYFPSLVSPCQN